MRSFLKQCVGKQFERTYPSDASLNQPRHILVTDVRPGQVRVENLEQKGFHVSLTPYVFKKYYTTPYSIGLPGLPILSKKGSPVYQGWIVANSKKLVKAYDDKIFHVIEEAEEECKELNKLYPNVWKVYEIAVDIL